MQQLNYSLLDKKYIIVIKRETPEKDYPCFGPRHNKMFLDDEVNDYINEQIKKAIQKLDEKYNH